MSSKRFYLNPISSKYLEELWYREIQEYMELRYPSIVNRIAATQRYVDIPPKNKDAFSYEYASILRDMRAHKYN